MNKQTPTIPNRSEVPQEYKWDLAGLFEDEKAWEEAFEEFNSHIPEIERFRGTLSTSVNHLFACLDFMTRVEAAAERLGVYAHLRFSEDAGDSRNQERFARYMQSASRMEAVASYQSPEIQAIPQEKMDGFLKQDVLRDFRIQLNRLLRFRPHILSEQEERLIAMQEEANQTAQKSFSALTDVDMEFGTIKTPEGERPLSQASYNVFQLHPRRDVREQSFRQFMASTSMSTRQRSGTSAPPAQRIFSPTTCPRPYTTISSQRFTRISPRFTPTTGCGATLCG
jgi:oligoendopeptidase F